MDDLLICPGVALSAEQVGHIFTQSIKPLYPPSPVERLEVSRLNSTSVGISWTAPPSTEPITGYNVYYATPSNLTPSIPLAIGIAERTYAIDGLSEATTYSFDVHAVSVAGMSEQGKIVRLLTSYDDLQIGQVDFDDTNADRLPLRFERTEASNGDIHIDAYFSLAFRPLSCTVTFQNGGTELEYAGINGQSEGGGIYSNRFTFQDSSADVAILTCWPENVVDGEKHKQVISIAQTEFPLLEQIKGFQAGDYGTQGTFGTLDMVALAAVLVTMVGFQRRNTAVGVILAASMLGVLAFFEMITLPTALFGAVAVVVMIGIAAARRDT